MNQFELMSAQLRGKLSFVFCPHHTDNPDMGMGTTRFVTLIDTPERVVMLVLCGVCCDTVVGAFAPDIVREAIDGMRPIVIEKILGVSIADSESAKYADLVREQVKKDFPQSP